MRVLFGIDTWGLVGGTERYAAVVIPALIERGHEVVVLCREAHEPDFGPGLDRVPVIVDPELGGEGLSPDAERGLRARARDAEPDVIFMQVARNLGALAALADTAPLVRFVHDHTLFCPGLNKYREDGELCTRPMGLECLSRYYLSSGCVCFKPAVHQNRWLDPLRALRAKYRELAINRRAAGLVTNSDYMRGELLAVGFDPGRVVALPMFTRSNTEAQPAGELPAATEDFLAGPEIPLVFTPARLTLPDKGVDYLLTALTGVRAEFRAVIAGTGPAEDWLRRKVTEEGLGDRVHFTGWLDQGGVEALYARAAVVVCPSVWNEPFGLVGLEAMAHSRPVAAFAVGGVPEWLTDGETGFLAPRRDTAALGAAVERLLRDPELAARLGRGGRRSLETRFSRERHMDLLEDVLVRATA